ncbi:MAG: hypothetical protein KJ015_19560 [Myxococcales bacterium]|nr:hypothetical protein [Myxococcales bacterium]
MSVAKRAVSGTFANAASFALQFVQTIALVPILLSGWGSETYGLWLAIQSVYALIITVDVGHQNYVGNEFLRLYTTDVPRLRATLAAGLIGVAILGAIELGLALLLIATGALPWALGLPGNQLPASVPIALCVLIAAWIVQGSLGGLATRLYPPAGLYARSIWLGNAYRVASAIAVAATVMLRGGILAAALAISAVTSCFMAIVWWDLRSRFANVYPFWKGGTIGGAWPNIGRSLVLTASSVVAQLQQHGVILLVAGRMGLALVPAYTTIRTLANVFLQASGVISGPLSPEVVRFHSLNQNDKVADIVGALWFVGGLCTHLGLSAALPLLQPLYASWTRGEYAFDPMLFALLAVAVSLRTLGSPLLSLLAGLNQLRAQAIIAVTQTAVVLAVAAALLPSIGLVATGVAVALGELIGGVVLPLHFFRVVAPSASRIIGVGTTVAAAAPCALHGAVFLAFGAGGLPAPIAAAASAGSACFAYGFLWTRLAPHVRARLWMLAMSPLRRLKPRS